MQHLHPEESGREYLKFVGVILFIVLASMGLQFLSAGSFELKNWMRLFMGLFFAVFGLFKVANLQEFVSAYSRYDLLAMRYKGYALLYPFVELFLAAAFLSGIFPMAVNLFTLVLMLFSGLGVVRVINNKEIIMCACLGTFIKLPVSRITLIEDFGMGLMALIMLLI
jgi:hypothetical protein